MTAKRNLTENECLLLLKSVSDALAENRPEDAAPLIAENLRTAFGVTRVSIREIVPYPYSLLCAYEALGDAAEHRHISETAAFEEAVWQQALAAYEEGLVVYQAGGEQQLPPYMAVTTAAAVNIMQVPMFLGTYFRGVLELADFESPHDWSARERFTLKICADMLCRNLYSHTHFNPALHGGNENDIDPLTGLMGFRLFTKKLDETLAALEPNMPVCVIYTDIHHFKYINETYGYKKGDELLKQAAQVMSNAAPPNTLVSRVYADHFVSASAIATELIPSFDAFIHEQNKALGEILMEICPDVRIRVVTGICYVNSSDITGATAIANANLARKTAKSENIHKPVVFSESMMEAIKYQEYLNNELPKAIENHDLKVYYQPKINCTDDSLYGAEALVRWQRPDGTFVYPDQFIPVFEKNGYIIDVDFYVYREVFRYIRGRIDAGLPVFPISMNVSRVHFRTDKFIPYIDTLLEEYKIPPELIEFELTENIYMKNLGKADAFVKACRSRGIQVSMDDFGSGYSSLNLISTISIDTLKIDKIFLKNDTLSDNDKTVIESMIAMAKRLGMKVICEGVETEVQTVFLKRTQCDQIQGYYYARPMDEAHYNQFIEQHHS